MTKKLLSILVFLLILTGCQQQLPSADLNIVTTIFPITDLVNRVVDGIDSHSVTQLMSNVGDNAHTWEPSAQDMILLEEADVFIYNGAGMEEWVDDVLKTLQNKDLLIVEASIDVPKIEGHEHEGHHEAIDPHTWSSPLSAKTQLLTISHKLQEAYPEYESIIKENTDHHVNLFDELHEMYKEALAPYAGEYLVVQHEAYGYLAHDYNLEQVGIEGLVPTSEPDPARMVEIIDLVNEYEVLTIFFEETVSDKVASTLASETGVRTDVLNTLAFENKEKDDLIKMMKDNLDVLVKGLSQ